MAYSWQEQVKPAGTQDIQCDIEYLDKAYIHVYINDVETTAYTWTSPTNIRLNSPLNTESEVLLVRKTEREYLYIQFASGAPFIEGNVDTQNTQFLHLAQELVEGRSIEGFYGDISMNGYRITHVGTPVDANDATTKSYVDSGDGALDSKISAEVAARIQGDIKVLDDAKDYTDVSLAGVILPEGLTDVGLWVPSAVSLMASTTELTPIGVRGFYRPDDGGRGIWIATGRQDESKAGTHVPASALLYNASGVEYKLLVRSGDTVNARANGASIVLSVETETEDFICIGEVINGITSQVKNFNADNDERTSLTVEVPSIYPLRQGKASIKAYSGLSLKFGTARIFTRPSPSHRASVTGVYMNAVERGIEDIQAISALYSGAATYGQMTMTNFYMEGGFFMGDHAETKGLADCSTGTGLFTFNMQNSMIVGTSWQYYAVGRQYVRTGPNKYYNNLGVIVEGTLVPEVSSSSTGSYEGVHEIDTFSYACKYLHLRTISNWANFDKCKFGTYTAWGNNPDGNQFEYFIENGGAAVNFNGGVIEANIPAARPTKGFVKDSARGATFKGVYIEYAGPSSFVIAKPSDSSNYRANGLSIDAIGSQYTGRSVGFPLVSFEEGFFGSYDDTGKYVRAGWETSYNYFAGVNTWHIGAPTPDLGAFPHGGFDFRYGTYGIHYSGDLPDVDSLRDTLEGNEFLSPYGLSVNSGTLLFPMLSPAHQSNVIVWYKDLTGNFNPRNATIGFHANQNPSDSSDPGLYQTFGTHILDYGNGYKALLIPNVNPRPMDNRMDTSSTRKLRITVDGTAPIILKGIQAYTGGISIFPSAIPSYIPLSTADRLWGTQSGGSTSGSPYYANTVGGGIFKMGDVVGPIYPAQNPALLNPMSYSASTGFGSSAELRTVSGGSTYGAAMSDRAFTLTVVSQDSTNGWTTVSVPVEYLPYVLVGMPLNVTANSSGGTVGSVDIVRRVVNSDGTLSASYVLSGLLGAAGTTLTVSTTVSYTFVTGSSKSLIGSDGNWSVRGYSTVVSGDARIGYGASSASSRLLRLYYDGTNTSATFGSSAANSAFITGTAGVTLNGTLLSSTTYSFGSASAYPANIYSQNAVTVVSDATRKAGIRELTPAELDVSSRLAKLFRVYKLKTAVELKGEDARLHVGTIAQLVIETFTDAGLDWHDYGVVTYEKWDASEAVEDDEGNVVSPAREEGEIYMVRYDELNALILAGQEARIAALESALSKEE